MHPPEPASYSQEPIPIGVPDDRPSVMPRRLKILYVLFSLMAAGGALTLVLAVFGVVALVTEPDVYGGSTASLAGELFLVGSYAGGVLTYGTAAVLLRRGAPTARVWAFVAIGMDASLVCVGALGTAVVEGPAPAAVTLLQLLVPGLFLLLLTTRSSREWFRATSA